MSNLEEAKAEIKRQISITELIGGYVRLNKKGSKYWGLCPFHSEKTASFSVTPDKEMYYCFGCHKYGDIFTFMMEIEKLSFMEALKLLAKKANVTLSIHHDPQLDLKRESLYDLYRRLTGSFHYLLMKSSKAAHARRYLELRGVSPELIERFQLGYAPASNSWLLSMLEKHNYSIEFIGSSGLFMEKRKRYIPYFFNRIMFPIRNSRGEVIAFGGRSLSEGGPKYLNSPETEIFKKGNNLFGLHHASGAIKENKCAYIVEGYMDVLSLHKGGIPHCVAPLGTALTEAQARLICRYTDNIILLFDGDTAGIAASLKALECLMGFDCETGVVRLPEGRDPDDILQKHGSNELKKMLKSPINSIKYLLTIASERYDSGTPRGKEEIFQFIVPYLKRISSQIKRDGYFEIIADAIHIDIASIRKDYEKQQRLLPIKAEKKEKAVHITDELFFMLALTALRYYFSDVRNSISVNHLKDEWAKEIYIALEECFRDGDDSLNSLLEKIENDELRVLILEKNTSDEFTLNPEKIIADGIAGIKKRNLLEKREEISLLIKQYEKTEPWKMKDLLVEKMVLDKEYEELRMKEDV